MINLKKLKCLKEFNIWFNYWKGDSINKLTESLILLPNLKKLSILCYRDTFE